MIITPRSCASQDDLQQVGALVRAFPDGQLHVADLPYRLASWDPEDRANARLWWAASGQLLAFAIIQQPWSELDTFVHPDARGLGIETAVLVWAVERMQELAGGRGERATLFVSAAESQPERAALLHDHGFAPADWGMVHLERPLRDVVPEPQVPDGFALRPLAGEREVEAYVRAHRAAFDSNAMTIAWRRRTLTMPEYVPELDVVAAAPDGDLAAFCVCWLSPATRQGQVEPFGVDPRHQGLGLGRATLLEGLWRLQAHGAETALVSAYADDEPALRLYGSVGFRPARRTISYARTFTP